MTDLDAIRARDAAADDCAVCEFSADMPHHGPVEDGCPVPKEHHDYVKGTPSFTWDRDRRALLAEVDRLTAELHRLQTTSGDVWWAEGEMAERARIRAAVEGLPPEHRIDNCVDRAAVLAAIEGAEK